MQGGMITNINSPSNDNNNSISPSHHHQLSLQEELHTAIHGAHFETTDGDHDFLDQMLSTINPAWPDFNPVDCPDPAADRNPLGRLSTQVDESAMLASKLREHQIGAGGGLDESIQALYNGFCGSIYAGGSDGSGQPLNQSPQFHHHHQGGTPSFGAQGQPAKPAPAASGSTTTGTGQTRMRVRARRGQATDPHSIAERLRRERIAERMKSLQELVPNANKTDKASMLDEIIDYVKFLQLQVKVLSMSRLGGAAAVAPLIAERGGGGDCTQPNGVVGGNNRATDSLKVTENQVVKLMEEDMGSAMQYLQGKGLCLMPISLASAISTATGRPPAGLSNPLTGSNNGDGPTSPSMSALTVQSAAAAAAQDGSSSPPPRNRDNGVVRPSTYISC